MIKKIKLIVAILGVASIISACATDNKPVDGTNKLEAICPAIQPFFTDEIALQLLTKWGNDLQWNPDNTTINSAAMKLITNNYSQNAVLLPTVSSRTRSTSDELLDYFVGSKKYPGFLSKHPSLTILKNKQKVDAFGCGYGVASGKYDFAIKGQSNVVHARYTYIYQYQPTSTTITFNVDGKMVYKKRPAGWYITKHNSAILPND